MKCGIGGVRGAAFRRVSVAVAGVTRPLPSPGDHCVCLGVSFMAPQPIRDAF